MDFLVKLFRNLLERHDWTVFQACSDSYIKMLKKWDGWMDSSSFTVAMMLALDWKKFLDVIGGTGDIGKFCTTFLPFLEENHRFLGSNSVDQEYEHAVFLL